MSTIPLLQSASSPYVSDGAGSTVARISLGPTVFGETWHVTQITCATTSAVRSSTFSLYKNTESPYAYLDGSQSGDNDASNTVVDMLNLDRLIGVFRGGSLGAICTMVLAGTKNTGR